MKYLASLFFIIVFFSPFPVFADENKHASHDSKSESFSLFDPDVLTKGDVAPEFVLTDQNGNAISLKSLKGRGLFLTFIFTTCDNSCPIILHNKKAIKEKIEEKLKVEVIFGAITIDPVHDTPAVLKEYAKNTNMDELNTFLLTGNPDKVKKVLKSYGIKVAKIAKSGKIVGHANMGYVISPDGVVSDILFFDL